MSRTYEQLEPVISALDERIKTGLGAFPTDTAEGSIASFADGADGIPLKSLVVDINPVQSGSGDPSPDNVRPISGWTGANVTRCGKNLIDVTDYDVVPNSSYSYPVWTGNLSGTFTLSVDKSGVTSVTNPGLSYGFVMVNGARQFLRYDTGNLTFTGNLTQISIYGSSAYAQVVGKLSLQLEVGSTATPYEPYNGTTIPIDWKTEAGTVYGGKLDVLSGVLTVYPYYASYNGETLTGRWISDRDVYAVGTTPTIGAQVVNIGAEGTEIQLSPHEVKSLLGQNNIFADTGDCSVEYRADTKMCIERLTEPDADMIADANITSGSYFMVGNILYKATANIASGSAVIEGTNATRKSLSEALNEINQ